MSNNRNTSSSPNNGGMNFIQTLHAFTIRRCKKVLQSQKLPTCNTDVYSFFLECTCLTYCNNSSKAEYMTKGLKHTNMRWTTKQFRIPHRCHHQNHRRPQCILSVISLMVTVLKTFKQIRHITTPYQYIGTIECH